MSTSCSRRWPDTDSVIPGWSEGPDLRCAIAHRGISRFRVRCGACHRARIRANPLASLRNDVMVFRANFPEAAASWLPPFVCRYRLAILAGAASLRQNLLAKLVMPGLV